MHNSSHTFSYKALAAIIVLLVAACALQIWKVSNDPAVPLLLSENDAEWIRTNEPVNLVSRPAGEVAAAFRTFVDVKTVPEDAALTVIPMRRAVVRVDGVVAGTTGKDLSSWKEPVTFDLASHLTPGVHEITITVMNVNGPALLLAYGNGLGLRTGAEGWEATTDGVEWKDALVASQFRPEPLSRRFPAAGAFARQLPILAPLFIAVFFWSLAICRPSGARKTWVEHYTPGVGVLRWVIIAAWAVLAVNNFLKVPLYIGFDSEQHLEYILFVAEKFSIPFANEGAQMFQSPLYYMLSAPVYLVLKDLMTPENFVRCLRLVPMLCGLLQVEITYRVVKRVFADRPALQTLGLLTGGLLPVNLYMSQSLGNEPMAGVFTAATLLSCFTLLHITTGHWSAGRILLTGVCLGLAMLSKVTAVLLLPPVAILLAYRYFTTRESMGESVVRAAMLFGSAFAVSSWYYIRNLVVLGKPFVGGWDPSRSIVWWQDPGYRVPEHFYRFGESLAYPMYSGLNGFWDSIYSSLWLDGFVSSMVGLQWLPPWNMDFMISGAWLALVPAIGIIIGVINAILRPSESFRRGELFAVICLFFYYAAILNLYLKLPIYTTAKASYTLGLTPAYAVLAASGLGLFMRTRILRSAIFGAVACWALSAYISYFAL